VASDMERGPLVFVSHLKECVDAFGCEVSEAFDDEAAEGGMPPLRCQMK
jgi:hypothetical protein